MKGGGFRIARENCGVWFDARTGEGQRYADARFRVEKGVLADQSEPVMPPVNDRRLYLVSAAGLDAFQPVFDGLAGISVFSLTPDVMRQPQTPDSGEFLHRDGANIASVLHRLDRADKARVEAYLHQIVPGMREVSRSELGNGETLEFVQDVPGAKNPWRFQAQSMSDGTLRALGVLVALFAGTGQTLSPVGIEAPESALHPAAVCVLLDVLRDASERRQVIVTTHSSDLLDRHDFELAQLRAVRSIGGETKIGALDAAEALAMSEQLYTPGELLRTDQLLPVTKLLSGQVR
ncbi:AAA family ATPase [Streptomyces sp. NPDC090053]|uniref:AAA family ATPase n=1 Tax=Streptomyces sp. NPDC090053 TaxID=3365932 RepID=UPI003824D92C